MSQLTLRNLGKGLVTKKSTECLRFWEEKLYALAEQRELFILFLLLGVEDAVDFFVGRGIQGAGYVLESYFIKLPCQLFNVVIMRQ